MTHSTCVHTIRNNMTNTVYQRFSLNRIMFLRSRSARVFLDCFVTQNTIQTPRCASTRTTQFLDIKEEKGVAILNMKKAPVNSLSLEMLTDLNNEMENIGNCKEIRGVILASSLPKMFSAGLDILELYQKPEERMRQFWGTLQSFWLKLYSSRKVTIAAINGHSPAGGCLMAMSCDARIMTQGRYTIGLNETQLGIIAPFWFSAVMIDLIGVRQADKALQLGSLFTPDDAVRLGLVDHVVDEDKLMESAQSEMKKWLKIPDSARSASKLLLRQPLIEKLSSNLTNDTDNFINLVTKDSTQKVIGMYLESLKKKA